MSNMLRPLGAAVRRPGGRDADRPDDSMPPPGLRVLVVEDLPINQKIVTLMLAAYGHTADLADNGCEALRRLNEGGTYDVVLMDIQMPIMDGVAATRAIRGLAGPTAAIPIVALTASVSQDLRRSYLEAGMDGVAEKPIDIGKLLAAMGRAIRSRNAPAAHPREAPHRRLVS